MGRLISLLIILTIGAVALKFLGFETTVVSILGLIYWAMPVNDNF
jgi:hypothetical protein